ncbi:MAG TPA: hypothetical protein VHM90_17185 [Phycisphaerae bacterium]|nr:hypothetical protein [Phycisphaerae bacterium]
MSLRPHPRRPRGLTLIECMMLMVVMSVVVVGTGVALQSLVKVPTGNNRALVVSNLMSDKMERLKALGFTALSATASGSDSVTVDNVAYTRTWTITANPGGTYDANFIQITVTIGNRSIVSAVCKQ